MYICASHDENFDRYREKSDERIVRKAIKKMMKRTIKGS